MKMKIAGKILTMTIFSVLVTGIGIYFTTRHYTDLVFDNESRMAISSAKKVVQNYIENLEEKFVQNGTIIDIEKISEVIANINGVIHDIATAVEEQLTATTEISTNISQASQGIGEVNENVAQSTSVIADITRDIAQINQQSVQVGDGSSQVEKSVKDLSALAEQLQNMVKKFKV